MWNNDTPLGQSISEMDSPKIKKIVGAVAFVMYIFFFPVLSQANPLVWEDDPRPTMGFLLAVPILLLLEGVILARLAHKTQPYFERFVGAWFLVTTITLALLMTVIESARHSNLSLVVSTMYFSSQEVIGILGELTVTVTESIALFYLLRSPKLTRQPELAPSWVKCLLYSLAANTFSFIAGILVTDIPKNIHNLYLYLGGK
jgi:hypothetical protein